MVDDGTATEDLMTHTARHRPRLLLALGVALALSACSSNTPEPGPPTTTTPAPARRPSPTPTPAPAPAPAADPNPAGLAPLPPDDIDKSFVTIENFFTAYEYGLRTGDASVLESLSGDKCGTCSKLAANIHAVRDKGDRARGGEFSIPRSTLVESTDPRVTVWQLELKQAATIVTHTDGSVTRVKQFTGRALVDVSDGESPQVLGFDTKLGS